MMGQVAGMSGQDGADRATVAAVCVDCGRADVDLYFLSGLYGVGKKRICRACLERPADAGAGSTPLFEEDVDG